MHKLFRLLPARFARGSVLPVRPCSSAAAAAWAAAVPPRSPASWCARAHARGVPAVAATTPTTLERNLPTRAFSTTAAAAGTSEPKSLMRDEEAARLRPLVDQLDLLFPAPKWKPAQLYGINPEELTHARYVETLDSCTALMDDPKDNLMNEYLGLGDAKPHAYMQECLKIAAETRGSLKAPIVAACAASVGKTRMLEELRLALLQRKERDVLPLAITFTGGMRLIPAEYDLEGSQFLLGAARDVKYAFAVMKRLLGVFYGKSLDKIQKVLAQGGLELALSFRSSDDSLATDVIRATIIHIVRATNRQRALDKQPKVATVVVMQDESSLADKLFTPSAQLQFQLATVGYKRTVAALCAALLNASCSLDHQLNVALVLTTVDIFAIPRSRFVQYVDVVPRKLSAEDVVKRWWGIKGASPPPPLAFVIAAAVRDSPLKVQICHRVIRNNKLAEPGAKWDEKVVEELWQEVRHGTLVSTLRRQSDFQVQVI